MISRTSITLPVGPGELAEAALSIRTLPGWSTDTLATAPLVEATSEDRTDDAGEARIQLIEDAEYIYEFDSDGFWTTDHRDLFSADQVDGRRGRLRTGSHTGTVAVTIFRDGRDLGRVRLEVRSRKLGYRTDYRWMLRDIAATSVGLIGERFATSEHLFAPDAELDGATAYQRFVLLQHLLSDPAVEASLRQVLANPHHQWIDEEEERDVRRGATGHISPRVLLLGRARVPWPGSYIPGLSSLPERIPVRERVPSVDTVPNRFVKFALDRWIGIVHSLWEVLERQNDTAARERGLRETDAMLKDLHGLRSAPLFHEVSDLVQFPSGNQVLLKREGYRELYRAYTEIEMGVRLTWTGGEEVFSAGQRDVATLYEYWCYLQLVGALQVACDTLDRGGLLQSRQGDTSLDLKRGRPSVIRGSARRHGRRVHVDLTFNQTFPSMTGSWTVTMRPDCSLRITTDDDPAETWVHFDAKYRIEKGIDASVTVSSDDEPALANAPPPGKANPDDLAKMHAYRDAIRRSAGAYVLYPGPSDVEEERFREYHEILPGLGAFALRPSETTGIAKGQNVLADFLGDLLDHVALVTSQYRRARYWEEAAHATPPPVRQSGLQPGLTRPPADTLVLIAPVADAKHLGWIHRERRYAVTADESSGAIGLRGDELAYEYILLYGTVLAAAELWHAGGAPEVWSAARLAASGSTPGHPTSLCLPLGPRVSLGGTTLASSAVEHLVTELPLGSATGRPTTASWALVAESSGWTTGSVGA